MKRFVVRGLSERLKGVEALAVAEALGRNAGRKVPFAENDVHVLLIRAREIHEKAAELLPIARVNRGRRGDEVHVVGIDFKGIEHAAQQERHFRRARADVGMRFVENDPFEGFVPLRRGNHPFVLLAQQHVFEHRRIGDEQVRDLLAHHAAAVELGRTGAKPAAFGVLFEFACVERIANIAVKRRREFAEALFLIGNERIEGIEKQRADPGAVSACLDFPDDRFDDRRHEAFGFSGSRAARDDDARVRVIEKEAIRFVLMRVRREELSGFDRLAVQQPGLHQRIERLSGGLPGEDGFEERFAQKRELGIRSFGGKRLSEPPVERLIAEEDGSHCLINAARAKVRKELGPVFRSVGEGHFSFRLRLI